MTFPWIRYSYIFPLFFFSQTQFELLNSCEFHLYLYVQDDTLAGLARPGREEEEPEELEYVESWISAVDDEEEEKVMVSIDRVTRAKFSGPFDET